MKDPVRIYNELGRLVEAMPDLEHDNESAESLMWLGRVYALVLQSGSANDNTAFREAMDALATESDGFKANRALLRLRSILYRRLAVAEMEVPAGVKGSFIPAGNSFEAMLAVGKVLGTAKSELLIIDPYMDAKALTDFGALAKEGVALKLMSDADTYKPTLKPAFERWIAQYGASRPLEVRLAPSRSLHDRLIMVDGCVVWILTQSLNAFAERAPASIVKVDDETARLKISAYGAIWQISPAI